MSNRAIDITLPDDLRALIEQRLRSGEFSSSDE
jgi:Arc/MetJ-type ribon-helix-helix transcriptional regulator